MLQNSGQNVQEIDAADELSKGEEQTMKDWLENYRPVRKRTVRSQTTKDKAGTLPSAVYSNANPNATARVFFPADQVEQTPTASSEMRSQAFVSDVSVLSFISDATVPQLTVSRQLQISTRWRRTRAIRMTVTMMSILSQKNWLLVSQ